MSIRNNLPPQKTLVVLGVGPTNDIADEVTKGECPRVNFLDIASLLEADVESYNSAKLRRGALFAKVFSKSPRLGSVISAFLRRNEYSRMYATGEDIGLPLAILLRFAGWGGGLTMVVHKSLTKKRKLLFRLAGSRVIHKLICVSVAQHRVLLDQWGLDGSKVVTISDSVDNEFFAPQWSTHSHGEYVFSCGSENRDYRTLAAAAEAFPFAIRIAASGWNELTGVRKVENSGTRGNVTTEKRLTYKELRDVYAQARFVVVPLNDVPYAAGVNGVLEAMAMGKALIVSSSKGISEYIKPGVSAITVPANDPRALTEAMLYLWNHPEVCSAMGIHNRSWVEREFAVADYCKKNAEFVSD